MPSRSSLWSHSPRPSRPGDPLALVQWISQTFLQLVLLSVTIVGQNITAKASDKRAELTYRDAEATFYEAQQIQDHLQVQDEELNTLLDKLLKLEAARTQASAEAERATPIMMPS